MYLISRMILTLSVLVWVYCFLLLGPLFHPYSWWVLGIVVFLILRRGGQRRIELTAYGTAAWASEQLLRAAGWLNPKRGMYIGALAGAERPTLRAGIGGLFDGTLSAKEACRMFYGGLTRRSQAEVVRMLQAVTTLIFAPAGAGKSSALVIPFIKQTKESCVVLDLSGELALATVRDRQKVGPVHLLDPYDVCATKLGIKPAARNVLDGIKNTDPFAIDLANGLAQALVVRTGQEKETHFLEMAERFIAILILIVLQVVPPEQRSLQAVAETLANPELLAKATACGEESAAWGGLLARASFSLRNSTEKERSSTLTTADRMLRWLSTLAMVAVTQKSTFDPADLKRRVGTVYVILPMEFASAQAGWLRSTINDLIMSIVRLGPDESRLVHFVLDESSSLGANLESAESLIDKFRKYGLRSQWIYQGIGQLRTSWPKDQGMTLLANSAKLFAGTCDFETAKLVSSMLGAATVMVEGGSTNTSGGTNSGGSEGQGCTRNFGSNHGWQSGESWQQASRELAKADEIMTMSPRYCITFPVGEMRRPIMTYLVRYHENPGLFRIPGIFASFRAACCSLLGSILLLVASLALAAYLTQAASQAISSLLTFVPSVAVPTEQTDKIESNYP